MIHACMFLFTMPHYLDHLHELLQNCDLCEILHYSQFYTNVAEHTHKALLNYSF